MRSKILAQQGSSRHCLPRCYGHAANEAGREPQVSRDALRPRSSRPGELETQIKTKAKLSIHAQRPQVSMRVQETDEPVIVKTKKLIAGAAGSRVVSLAQGKFIVRR